MSLIRRPGSALLISLAAAWPVAALAQFQIPNQPVQPAATVTPGAALRSDPVGTTMPATIGSHQINRFAAIRQLQAELKSDANNLANWAILGELAHEVAVDLPDGQDEAFFKLSREAYERATQLDPNNNGLQAAVQFAREQEANSAAFEARRRQAIPTYLDARRREMATNGVNPTILVYEPTSVSSQPAIGPGQPQPAVSNQPYGTTNPTPTYRPYYNPQAQQPLGYNQYSNAYAPPTTNPTQTTAPTTLRQYGQQLPGVLINQMGRSINQPVTTPRPR